MGRCHGGDSDGEGLWHVDIRSIQTRLEMQKDVRGDSCAIPEVGVQNRYFSLSHSVFLCSYV